MAVVSHKTLSPVRLSRCWIHGNRGWIGERYLRGGWTPDHAAPKRQRHNSTGSSGLGGIKRSHLAQLELGKREAGLRMLEKIAEALGIPIRDLL